MWGCFKEELLFRSTWVAAADEAESTMPPGRGDSVIHVAEAMYGLPASPYASAGESLSGAVCRYGREATTVLN